MTFIRVTNPYHNELFKTDEKLEAIKQRYEGEIANEVYFNFIDIDGKFVTICPKQFASVEIWEG